MTLFSHFEDLQDPRIDRTKHYELGSLVFLTIAAVVADCDSYTQIADFAQDRLEWFQGHGHFMDGRTPSHDVLNNLFRRMAPGEFQACFMRWTSAVCGSADGTLVSIDGKTLRRSHDALEGKRPIHLISAWSSLNQVVLAQMMVDGKSNEITAIPELLALLDLKGAIVSIDAMGCQTAIAEKIIEREGNYLLGLKGNQSELLEMVEIRFVHHRPTSSHTEWDKGHGRIESRICDVIALPAPPDGFAHWKGLKSLVRIVSIRQRVGGGEPVEEIRFYISSAQADAKRFSSWVRGHWGIENKVHWMLDVIFDEDGSRIRKGHGDRNLAIVRRIALNICHLYTDDKKTAVRRRKSAARNDAYLDALLGFKTR
ncbi:MAG: ISAs1 family transposase [Flavobacteriales bacterium]|nr:ISAs1 family transposase [Flavobacteriales bacterium]